MYSEPLTGDDEQFVDGEWYERTNELRLRRYVMPRATAIGSDGLTICAGDMLQQRWVAPSGKTRWERIPVVMEG